MARVCTYCGLSYPDLIMVCPHDGNPTYMSPSATAAAAKEQEETETEEQFPLLRDAPLEARGNALVIDSHELIRRGTHRRLQHGEVYRVEVEGFESAEFYIEILDYLYDHRLYLVREFKPHAPDYVPEEWTKEDT